MKRNKINIGALFAGVALTALMLLGGCTKDQVADDSYLDLGSRTHAKLSIGFGSETPAVVTRGVYDKNFIKLNSIWVGVFDTKTGEMIGYKVDDRAHTLNKADGTAVMITNESSPWTMSDIDIYFYDSNPEAYIVSVANYEGVKARKVGSDELVDLKELLGIVDEDNTVDYANIKWADITQISIDTESADAQIARNDEYPLVMGYFCQNHKTGTSNGMTTHSQVHPTIDHYGKINRGDVAVRLIGESAYSDRIDLTAQGAVYFQRLLAQVNVYVQATTSTPQSLPLYPVLYPGNYTMNPFPDPRYPSYSSTGKSRVEIKGLWYKVINKPREVYLVEHATDKRGPDIHAERDVYLSRTANSADWLDDGYASDEDWIPVPQTEDGMYVFSYQHYENKHWGRDWKYGEKVSVPADYWDAFNEPLYQDNPDSPTYMDYLLSMFGKSDPEELKELSWSELMIAYCNNFRYYGPMYTYLNGASHFVREARMADAAAENGLSDLFMTLCLDDRHPYNNNASYIILKADVDVDYNYGYGYSEEEVETRHAIAYYTIHEGFTSDADGSNINAMMNSNGLSGADMQSLVCDYQTIRNTQYYYSIVITGLETMMMQAMMGWYGEMIPDEFADMLGDYHNDGMTADMWDTSVRKTTPDGEDFVIQHIPLSKFKTMQWRYYEKTPDGESNYGSWTKPENTPAGYPNWPSFSGTLSTENIPDELLNGVKFLVFEYPEIPTSEPGAPPQPMPEPELKYQDLNILEVFALPEADFNNRYMYVQVNVESYDWPNSDYEHIEEYERRFYFEIPPMMGYPYDQFAARDKDGCELHAGMVGIVQDADTRYEITDMSNTYYGYEYNFTAYDYNHYNYYNSSGSTNGYYNNWRLWQGARNMSAYISWTKMYCYTNGYGSFFPDTYIIKIVGRDEEYVVKIPEYQHPSYSNYIMYELPIPGDMEPGLYSVEIRPVGNPAIIKPLKEGEGYIYRNKLYIHDSEWDFSYAGYGYNENPNNGPHNGVGPLNSTDDSGYYWSSNSNGYSWGGMLWNFYNYVYIYPQSVNMQGSGCFNNRCFRFTPSVPGTFVVKLRNYGGANDANYGRPDDFRRINLSVGTQPNVSTTTSTSNADYESKIWLPVKYEDNQVIEYALSMKSFVDKFYGDLSNVPTDGPAFPEFAIYCKEGLYIYSIKFVPATEDPELYDKTDYDSSYLDNIPSYVEP